MATQTRERQPAVKVIDDSAEGPAVMSDGSDIREFIDETSLKAQTEKFAKQNRAEARGFRQYQKKVIAKAGLPNTHQVRQLASNICGAVARLSFVPDSEEKIEDAAGRETTEFEQQIIRTAGWAEEMLGAEAVYTVSARKLARAALELRQQDPDGKKGVAWVNDTREDEAGVLDD